jgi:hypothetical protein
MTCIFCLDKNKIMYLFLSFTQNNNLNYHEIKLYILYVNLSIKYLNLESINLNITFFMDVFYICLNMTYIVICFLKLLL